MILQGYILKMRPNSVLTYEFVSATLQNITGANFHATGSPVNLQLCPRDLAHININIKYLDFFQNLMAVFGDELGSSGFCKGRIVGARGGTR
jgi:hypothetical protein